MDDPVKELPDVIRSITEPDTAAEIISNIDKFFTDDCYISFPYFDQPPQLRGKKYFKGVYKFARVNAINNKIDFLSVMFNEDKTQAAVEMREYMEPNYARPKFLFPKILHYITRVDLRKEEDGKYRIWRQEDNFSKSTALTGFFPLLPTPFINPIIQIFKLLFGAYICITGRFLLDRKLLGP